MLSELLDNSPSQSVQKCREQIENYAYGYLENKQVSSPRKLELTSENLSPLISPPPSLHDPIYIETVKHEGVLLNTKSKVYQQQKEILRAIEQLNQVASADYGTTILLFDGLDRLNDSSKLLDLISQDIQAISKIGIGSILVASLATMYNEREALKQNVTTVHYQPYLDVENDSEAYDFSKKFLKSRSDEEFIGISTTNDLIKYSGGVLRDLISLTQSAIEEAYLANSDSLKQVHVATAVDLLGRARILGISDQELRILENILMRDKFIPRAEEDIKLLMTQRVLEYQYPTIHYAVHPAIRPLIAQINLWS